MKTPRKHLPFYLFLLVLVWKSSSLVQAQSNTHTGDITVTTQAAVDALGTTLTNIDTIDGRLTIGYTSGSSRSDITNLTPLRNITHITGYLTVEKNGQLVNLTDLNNLQSVGGNFGVRNNDQLTTLGNFTDLQSIRGGLIVRNNDTLTTFGDFPSLQTIGETFEVFSNPQLTTLGDFTDVQSVGEGFNVNANSNLTTLGTFTDLQSVGGDFNVSSNANLATLGNFPNLQSVGGSFGVNSNFAELTTLGNFPVLQSIGEEFEVSSNSELLSLGNFPVLQSIGEEFEVSSNRELLSLGDFPALTSIGIGGGFRGREGFDDSISIVVEENPKLILCSWLEKFIPTGENAVTGHIYIQDNATGCETTEEINNSLPLLLVNNSFFIHKDSTTTSFNIYANVRWQLSTSDDDTWITSLSSGSNTHSSRITGENEATITLIHTRAPNETPRSTTLTLTAIDEEGDELVSPAAITINLTQLSGFYKGDITLSSQEEVNEFISNTTVIDGNLTIGYTDFSSQSDITDLTPLSDITDITGNLNIQQNEQLVNFTDLTHLQSIGGSFHVLFNGSLTTLRNFSNLQSIGGDFLVGINSNLSTLEDFSNLQSIGGFLSVQQNNVLTTFGDFPSLQSIGGGLIVQNNDTLTTLGNFPALTSIGINNDVQIPSLGEVRNNVSMVVENNSSLSNCSVLADLLPGEVHAVSGDIYINNNATGCNSPSEIIAVADAAPMIMLISHTDGDSIAIAYDEVVAQTIMFSIGGATGWTSAITGDDFITLDTDMNVAQDTGVAITVTATPTENTGVERSAAITFTTMGGTGAAASATITVTQEAPPLPPQTSSTHTGDISITTQAQMDTIRNSLTAGATRIMGNVTIGPATGTSNITDLSPLAAIIEITGNVVIQRNPRLTNLLGVTQLQSIGGNLQFSINVNLQTLGNFSALQSIGGAFIVEGNDDLLSLGGFTSLTSIGSADGIFVPSTGSNQDGVSIVVEENDALLNCCVLTTFLSGAANAVSGQVFINDNATGCSSITQVNCDPLLQVDQTILFAEKTAIESTLRVTSTRRWQLSKPNTGAEWITNMAADGGNSDTSSITGENYAFITITTTANPNDAGRSTTLTLRGIDQAGNALTDPAPVTIFFNQLGTTSGGDVTLRSQAAVNAFSSNVTAIRGDLIIRGGHDSDITDLRALSGITHVRGGFWVGGNDALTSLGDFSALQSIGGSFSIGGSLERDGNSFNPHFLPSGNRTLTSLGDFSALQSIGGTFDVRGNTALTSLGEFPMLKSIGSAEILEGSLGTLITGLSDVSIIVAGNDLLQDCCVLTEFLSGATNAVSGKVRINDNAPGCNSTTKVNCDPLLLVDKNPVFATKTASEGTLEIFSRQHWQLSKPDTGADWITNIAADGGNSNASSITGENYAFITITITTNPSDAGRSTTLTLTAIDMDGNPLTNPVPPVTILFTQLGTTYTGSARLEFQRWVDTLRLPANATVIQGDLTIGNSNNNSDITDLRRLNRITHVTGSVIVLGNDRLVSLGILGNLQAIGGDFEVSSNRSLTSLGDFPTLQSIGGGFLVRSNSSLDSLGDFSALQSIGGSFVVTHHGSLASLGDFTALQTIGGSFVVGGRFSGNRVLTSLGDFPALQTIGGSFDVNRNEILTSLGDFPTLQTIGGVFSVYGNNRLDSLGDFSTLQSIGGSFEVSNNRSLTSLGDFPTLQSIGGSFGVGQFENGLFPVNRSLTSLGDFPALQSIGGAFSVVHSSLTSLGGFPMLASIGSADGIYVPTTGGTRDGVSIVVERNGRLKDCCVLTEFFSGATHAVSGRIFINSTNATGCNSQAEINLCLLSAQTITFTSPDTGTVGTPIMLAATASSGLEVTFAIESQTPNRVATLIAGTTLTLENLGTVVITATQAGDTTYAPTTQTQTIKVLAAPPVAIRRVTTTGAGTGDGSSWANAMMLQAALSASTTAGDQVWIAEGTYKPHADDRAATFSISTGVLVYGGFDGTEADDFDPANNLRTGSETILSGDLLGDDIERPAAGSDQTAYDASRDDNSYTVVTISGADLTLDGLVISGGERGTEEDKFGNTKYYGAGLYGGSGAGGLTLQNVILRSNNAEHEGGGAYFKSTVSVTNSTFTNNTATEDGGGAYFNWITTITGSTFSNNRTSDGPGGGAYFGSVNITNPNISSVATVTNSTFTNNSVSDDRGGGAYFDGSATVTGCTFSNNSATGTLFTSGGGAYFDDDATVVNCVFANNRADGNGGGAYFSLFSFGNINSTVTNSTFYSNSGNQGGGIYANYGVTFGSNTTNINLRNNILMNNTANAGADELYIGTQNASQTASIDNNLIQGGNNEPRVLVITDDGVSISNIVDASDAAVVFVSTDSMNANYLRLKAGSPAVNVGNNSYIPAGITTDAAGNARIQDGTVDLGAYEGVSSVDAGTVELGIEDAVDDLVLYPNPTSGKLHFSEQVEEFHLYSSECRLLETQENVRSADLTALPSGLYFVEVIRGGQSVGYRIVRK